MSNLTRETVADLTAWMPPQDAEVVALVFIRNDAGRWTMAAPIPLMWPEMLALASRERGLVQTHVVTERPHWQTMAAEGAD